jgi:flagellar hook-associated protein 2
MTAINTTNLASSLTGNTFDWQTFVDTIIEIDRAPIKKLQSEQDLNSDKIEALGLIKTNLADLQAATKALSASSLFAGRTATSSTSGSNWTLTAASGATAGAYSFNVTQLATSSSRNGTGDISSPISATADVSGVTLATMATAPAITAGTFTVNGATVTIALTDSLQDVFGKISTATGGAVTASYNQGTDKISFSAATEIVLGGANDTSNFLAATQLANNGTGTITSTNSLGAANTTATLANARLKSAITAVDGTGAGSFNINGVAIAYNVNTDSLSSIISRINSSNANVTASYDTAADRMVLTNKTTGDIGFGLSEAPGGFLDAVGLSMTSVGAATTRGKNALFSINGGATLSSTSNTLSSATTGITGLTVKAGSTGSQTITVASDTATMKTAIQTFVDKYNVVQSFIDLQTKITVKNGTLTTSTLSGTRDVDQWASNLRTKAFAAVSGLTGTITRLADLGIDFNSTSRLLNVKDSGKLQSALETKTADVEAFFNTATTGFASKMDAFLNTLTGSAGATSAVSSMSDRLLNNNASIDKQIAQIERQLESEKARLTAGFQAMQAAQSNAQSIIKTLQNSFDNSNKNN